MDSSKEIRQKFAHTDFKRQTRVVAESLWVISVAAQGPRTSPAWGDLPQIAARHSRNDLDIRPGLYDNWLDCLVEAARKHDVEFSPEIEDAWRRTLAVGIEYMGSVCALAVGARTDRTVEAPHAHSPCFTRPMRAHSSSSRKAA